MPKMLVSGKLARALSALGGRNLSKTSELLAGNLAELFPEARIQSNGTTVTFYKGKQVVAITPEEGKPVFRGNYYVYQRGSLAFTGEKRALEELKVMLSKLASQRKHYLLQRYSTDELAQYDLDTAFIVDIEKSVNELQVV